MFNDISLLLPAGDCSLLFLWMFQRNGFRFVHLQPLKYQTRREKMHKAEDVNQTNFRLSTVRTHGEKYGNRRQNNRIFCVDG